MLSEGKGKGDVKEDGGAGRGAVEKSGFGRRAGGGAGAHFTPTVVWWST